MHLSNYFKLVLNSASIFRLDLIQSFSVTAAFFACLMAFYGSLIKDDAFVFENVILMHQGPQGGVVAPKLSCEVNGQKHRYGCRNKQEAHWHCNTLSMSSWYAFCLKNSIPSSLTLFHEKHLSFLNKLLH